MSELPRQATTDEKAVLEGESPCSNRSLCLFRPVMLGYSVISLLRTPRSHDFAVFAIDLLPMLWPNGRLKANPRRFGW